MATSNHEWVRSLVSELRDVRNRWAHQHAFSMEGAYRALNTAHRLLTAVSAAEQAREVDRQRQEILWLRFEEEAKQERRRAAQNPTEGQSLAGLRPWREVITPHRDVASGRYQQAEFAADLGQVQRGKGCRSVGATTAQSPLDRAGLECRPPRWQTR